MSDAKSEAAAFFGFFAAIIGVSMLTIGLDYTGWVTEAQLEYYGGVVVTGVGIVVLAVGCWLLGQAAYAKVVAE